VGLAPWRRHSVSSVRALDRSVTAGPLSYRMAASRQSRHSRGLCPTAAVDPQRTLNRDEQIVGDSTGNGDAEISSHRQGWPTTGTRRGQSSHQGGPATPADKIPPALQRSGRLSQYATAGPTDANPGFRPRIGRDEQKVCVAGNVRNSCGSLPSIKPRRLLQFAGGVGRYDMDRDCRAALQIWKLLLLAMNFSMRGAAEAWSRLQPLG
jgi:hypothetical protein